MDKRIAVIGGAGKMGRWLAEFLSKSGFNVVIADRDKERLAEAGTRTGVETAGDNAEAIASSDYVLLSVPIEDFEGVVRSIAPDVQPGQFVIDVTSVKEKPVEIMHRYLPENVALGAHPLFGPGAQDIANKNFIFTPTTPTETALAEKIQKYLEGKGARVSLMTPAEHDEMMSLVLALSHFIALAAADTFLGASRLHPMDAAGSSTYKVLMTLIESVLSEDPALYASIQTSLPRAADFEREFVIKAGEWAKMVADGNGRAFVRRMQELKDRLEEVAPGFAASYEKMYRLVEGL